MRNLCRLSLNPAEPERPAALYIIQEAEEKVCSKPGGTVVEEPLAILELV